MESEVVLTFKNGAKLKTCLSAPFRSEENAVRVYLPDGGSPQTFSLNELCCIGMLGSPTLGEANLPEGGPEVVEIATGDRFKLYIRPDQLFHNGFFGVPADNFAPFARLFITWAAVQASQLRHSAPPRPEDAVLAHDAALPGRADGTRTLRNAPASDIVARLSDRLRLNQLPYYDAKVGEILINDGLVTRDQVENALSTKEKKKTGALLMERGLVSEDQLLAALAAKFWLPFVDLCALTPSPEALATLSKGTVYQMKVLPIDLEGKTLVVATSRSERPASTPSRCRGKGRCSQGKGLA